MAAAIGCYSCLAQTPPIPEIVTDRPDITESSTVIPLGSVQVENGFTWTRDQRISAIDLPEMLVRVGCGSARRCDSRLRTTLIAGMGNMGYPALATHPFESRSN